jgi:hypothetical protein
MDLVSGDLQLPPRSGERPETTPTNPHQQVDQTAPAAVQEELWRRMGSLEGVRTGRSGISLPESRALHLDPALAHGPPEAFLVGTEFGHLHGAADGSLHVALPTAAAEEAIDKGWAELHPMARQGLAPPNLVMLYGPRDEAELETIWKLVETSYSFARGNS